MDFFSKKVSEKILVTILMLSAVFFYSQNCLALDVGSSAEAIIGSSNARSQTALDQATSFFIDMDKNIKPDSSVNLTAISYSFDINGSFIVWRANGKVIAQGTGAKTATVAVGHAGQQTKMEVSATTPSGQTYHVEKILAPASIDMLWEAQTYVPPWYKGKPLLSSTSNVLVVAMPDFKTVNQKTIPASDLVYAWKLNYQNFPSSSGYGKNSFLVQMPQLGYEARVEVEVSTKDKSIISSGAVTLVSDSVETILYENHPTQGTEYNNPITKTIKMAGQELGIKVEPFFFALKDFGKIVYAWQTNGQPIGDSAKLNNKVFTREAGQKGVSSLSVAAQNPRDYLETSGEDFLIDFND